MYGIELRTYKDICEGVVALNRRHDSYTRVANSIIIPNHPSRLLFSPSSNAFSYLYIAISPLEYSKLQIDCSKLWAGWRLFNNLQSFCILLFSLCEIRSATYWFKVLFNSTRLTTKPNLVLNRWLSVPYYRTSRMFKNKFSRTRL